MELDGSDMRTFDVFLGRISRLYLPVIAAPIHDATTNDDEGKQSLKA
jgi:hypothetical protein